MERQIYWYPEKYEFRVKGIKEKFNLKQLLELTKQYDIKVNTPEGYDYTKEFLVKLALWGFIPEKRIDDSWDFMDFLTRVLDTELLYEVIRDGGLGNWVHRQRRGV